MYFKKLKSIKKEETYISFISGKNIVSLYKMRNRGINFRTVHANIHNIIKAFTLRY